jgi:hypothetical protein
MHVPSLRITLTIAITGMVCFFSGCSKAPDAELAAAKAAIKSAQDAEADKYMARNFENVQKALKMAEDGIAAQKKGFFLTRKYKVVTEMLTKTTELANELAAEAPKKKAEMIAQVKENLSLVDGMLKATAKDIKKNSRGKDKNLIKELKDDLSNAESAAASAAKAFDAGDVFGASENLGEVQRLMKKITDTLKPKTEE